MVKFSYNLLDKESKKPFDDPDLPESLQPTLLPSDTENHDSTENDPHSPGGFKKSVVRVVSTVCDKCNEKKYLDEVLWWQTEAFGKIPETKEKQIVQLLKFCKEYAAKDHWIRGAQLNNKSGISVVDIAGAMVGGNEIFEFLDNESKGTYIKMAKKIHDMIMENLHRIEKEYD